jgi:hypothetical protein
MRINSPGPFLSQVTLKRIAKFSQVVKQTGDPGLIGAPEALGEFCRKFTYFQEMGC